MPYELLAGFNATIDYLDSIGGFAAIVPYERSLGQRFLDGISDAVTVYGLPGMDGRVPTFLVNVDGVAAEDVAARLAAAADRGLGARLVVLAGPVPAPRLRRQVGADRLHPLQHAGEVDRLVAALGSPPP